MKQQKSAKSYPRIGVLPTRFQGHYQLELISGIETAARQLNAQIIYLAGYCLKSPHLYEANHNIVYETAVDASLDGLIIFSLLANYCDDNELVQLISRYKNIPVITLNLRSSMGNAILSDIAIGFKALMKHLITEHSYRKLAFIKGPEYSLSSAECYNTYESSLIAAGIPVDPALITTGKFRYRSGQEAVKIYLDERRLEPGKDIEVIICANDTMAFGVIDELDDRGLLVPDDLAVTGFDNAVEWIFPKSPLTTVKQHLHEIGKQAVYSLLNYKPHQEPVYFETELIIRNSCGCPYQADKMEFIPGPESKPQSAERAESSVHKKDVEFIFQKILSIIDKLKALQKMTEFTPWMKSHLPVLRISCAWLFLSSEVSSGIRTYKCIAGYDLKEPGEERPEEEVPAKIIFDDFLSKKNHSFCILPVLFKDEFYGLLIIEVNKMAYLLYDSLSQHIGSTIKNMLLIEELASRNLELRKSNEQKTQFFINVAHETRTPLTLIGNYLALYLEQHQPDEKLLVIKRNIDLLLAYMVNFLDVEKLQRGETIYQHDSLVDLSESAHGKYNLFQAMAVKKKIRIILNVKDQVVIKIDPWALDRIFNNLLDNAVKYIRTGGQIKLDVWNEDGKAMLRISDNGPGLPGDSFKHIFEPYYLFSKKNAVRQGMGVGLTLIKKIIDEVGASIEIESHKERGACFTIAFKDFSSAPHETLQKIPATTPVSPLVQSRIKEHKINTDKLSLLIVDDNVQLLKFMRTSLEESYNVILARSTNEALIKLKSMPRPDLIISDVMMDGPDGFQLLTVLMEKEGYNNIPFIFLTALDREKDKIRGLNLGAVDYIEKPFSMAAIKAKIESIVNLRKRQEKEYHMNIHNRIGQLFFSPDNKTESSHKLKFKHLCKRYGIIGREQDIVRLLMKGLVHKEMATSLNVSRHTVEYYLTKIYKKCGVKKKSDLLKLFRQ